MASSNISTCRWLSDFLIIIPQADENLRLIKSSLPEAVEACVDAAGHEFDVLRQQTLLRAASYGQAFCRWAWFGFSVWYTAQNVLKIVLMP